MASMHSVLKWRTNERVMKSTGRVFLEVQPENVKTVKSKWVFVV
jgi:hypothetical protein